MLRYSQVLSIALLFSLPIIGMQRKSTVSKDVLEKNRAVMIQLQQTLNQKDGIEANNPQPVKELQWEQTYTGWQATELDAISTADMSPANLTQTLYIQESFKKAQNTVADIEEQKRKVEEAEKQAKETAQAYLATLIHRLNAKNCAIEGQTFQIAEILKQQEELKRKEQEEREKLTQFNNEKSELEKTIQYTKEKQAVATVATKEETEAPTKKKSWFGW